MTRGRDKMNKIFKVASILAILSMLASFFGCISKPKYTAKDIEVLSISCGHMDLSKSYSFSISLKDGKWIFYGDCVAVDGKTKIKIQAPIESEDAEKLLNEAEKSGFITCVQKYKKPLFKPEVADETVYSSLITFYDGNTVSAPILGSREIENSFYSLAEKYGTKL